jgi:hypothetical protein
MTDYYPLSIVVHGIALNITVQSHVDQLCFGLIACRRAVPDVHELGAHVQRAMATLRAWVAPALAAKPAAAAAAAATPAVVAAAEASRAKPRRARAEAKPARPARQPRLRVVAASERAAKPRKTRPAAAAR